MASRDITKGMEEGGKKKKKNEEQITRISKVCDKMEEKKRKRRIEGMNREPGQERQSDTLYRN